MIEMNYSSSEVKMLHRAHFIEKWGRGIRLILNKEPNTQFKEIGTHFVVIFKRKQAGKSVGGITEKLGVKLGVNESAILDLILKDKHVTILRLAQELHISTTAVENNLARLKKKNLIKRIGSDKKGFWKVEIK